MLEGSFEGVPWSDGVKSNNALIATVPVHDICLTKEIINDSADFPHLAMGDSGSDKGDLSFWWY